MNEEVYRAFPDVQTYAEESTAWPMVSRPTYIGGLGFGYKWDMGWMHDTLQHLAREPVHRRFHYNELTFRAVYVWTENYLLPLSHDEVVHGKGSLAGKMPGDRWQQLANLRTLLAYQWASPGKKLLFMGGEIGQWREWDHESSVDWDLLAEADHAGVKRLVGDLNRALRTEPALHERDADPAGFGWAVADDPDDGVLAFVRYAADGSPLLFVANFTPVVRRPVPDTGAGGRVLARDRQHRRAPVRRIGRRQPRRRRRGTGAVAAVLLVVDAAAPAARRAVPPARRRDSSPTTGNRRASAREGRRLGARRRGRVPGVGTTARSRRRRDHRARTARVTRSSARRRGYHEGFVDGLGTDVRYRYAIGDALLPDPASRSQPDGVHGDSAVIDPEFAWSDPEWVGRVITDFVISEIHVGTFTDAGTFDAVIERLDDLRALGITAIELMPVAQFPGTRNWGYDGVFPYAAQSSYGGADGLRRLVDACHARGLSVVLDVVYNHLGPEGNVLAHYGPYFTDRYRTPWGDALNFDDRGSDEVRNYFVENAVSLGLGLHDRRACGSTRCTRSPTPAPTRSSRSSSTRCTIARRVKAATSGSSPRARPTTRGSSRRRTAAASTATRSGATTSITRCTPLLTDEREEYYADYGRVEDLATAYRDAFVYAGRYSESRDHRFGRSAAGLPGQRFVVFAQNHDQIGNRAIGDRLSTVVDHDRLRVAAAAVLCAPFLPLLFMGEEYGETSPFPYFVDHSDPDARRRGAARAARRVRASSRARRNRPTRQAPETFAAARLHWSRRTEEPHAAILDWHARLLELRRDRPALQLLDPGATRTQAFEAERVLVVTREAGGDAIVLVLGFGAEAVNVNVELPAGPWAVLLDSHPEARALVPFVTANGELTTIEVPAASVLLLGAEAR